MRKLFWAALLGYCTVRSISAVGRLVDDLRTAAENLGGRLLLFTTVVSAAVEPSLAVTGVPLKLILELLMFRSRLACYSASGLPLRSTSGYGARLLWRRLVRISFLLVSTVDWSSGPRE